MKKKYSATIKDKKDWSNFTKQIGDIHNKDEEFSTQNTVVVQVRKLDLHGFSVNEANERVKKFINDSFIKRYKKILIITGKGIRSKVYKDPYRSEKMNILRHSVPEHIINDEDLFKKINKIKQADPADGGEGAFYIFLKSNKNLKNEF